MTQGRKATPTALKELHGNPGKRALPIDEPEGVGDLWAPPSWFDDDQREQWNYAIDHAPPGLLTGTDRETLAIWCVACVEWAKAAMEVRRLGQVVKTAALTTTNSKTGVTTTSGGNAIQNPFMAVMNKQAMIMLKAGSEMGFSPAARASLGASAPEFDHGQATGRTGRLSKGGLAGYLEHKPDSLN